MIKKQKTAHGAEEHARGAHVLGERERAPYVGVDPPKLRAGAKKGKKSKV